MNLFKSRLPATFFAVSMLALSACGGGGDFQTSATPDAPVIPPPPPVVDDGRPDGFAGEPRTDFVLPYQTPDRGITTVRAGSFTGGVLRTTDTPEFIWQEHIGQWDNGALRQDRPYQLIYLSANRWMRLSLRDSTSSPVDTGVRASSTVCRLFSMRSDYANPAQGVMTYQSAGDDMECDTADDQVLAFRLDRTDAPTVLSAGPATPPRIFRNPATGSLSGLLIQEGSTLKLFNANLSSSRVIAEGISERVGFLGFSSAQLWATWANGANRAIYRIDANGTVTSMFETTVGARFLISSGHQGGGLYFTHRPNSSGALNEIVRIPSNGGAATVVYRGEKVGYVDAVSSTGLIYTSSVLTSAGEEIHMLTFGTGTAAATDEVVGTYQSGMDTSYSFPRTTRDGRFMLSLRNVAEDGSEHMSAHLVAPGRPELSKAWPNSEWLGAVAEDLNLNTLDSEPVTHGVLVKAFTGDYRTSGHGGGTLTLYSFGTNKEYAGPVVPEGSRVGVVEGTVSSPIGLTTLTTKRLGSDQNTVDIFGFNLRDILAEQVTNTPTENEVLIFP